VYAEDELKIFRGAICRGLPAIADQAVFGEWQRMSFVTGHDFSRAVNTEKLPGL
jgi:hypothetical protein